MAGKITRLEIGTVYKKDSDGSYYFRYQVNGQRKAVSLKTKNHAEAIDKAQKIVPLVKATTAEVISAHVKEARGLVTRKKSLPLNQIWDIYSKHSDRATPSTVSEQNAYKSTLEEFIRFIGNENADVKSITSDTTNTYSNYLKGSEVSVSTHNRKIKRLRRIFTTLDEYRDEQNPFSSKSLMRKEREEQENEVRRMSFTKEQEQQLLKALSDDKYKVLNKPEIRLIYYLGMFTGQRFKDCILLKWDKVDLRLRKIWVKQFKTGKEVTIPMAPELLNILPQALAWKANEYVCPNVAERYRKVDSNGKNTGNNLVNIDALRVIKWIGLEPSVKVPGRKKSVTVYGFHSLRHSFASHCAEAGVPKAVVLSILGTNSEIVDRFYTHIGEDAQEKAILAISGNHNNSLSDYEKISKALALIKSLETKPDIVKEIENILSS
ncbi:MAG: tyrosine-type recombinase/integrase [Lentisphaerota bacterium]